MRERVVAQEANNPAQQGGPVGLEGVFLPVEDRKLGRAQDLCHLFLSKPEL